MVSRVELLEESLEWAIPWTRRFVQDDFEAAIVAAESASPPGRRVAFLLHVDRTVAAALALATAYVGARRDDLKAEGHSTDA